MSERRDDQLTERMQRGRALDAIARQVRESVKNDA